MAQPCQECQFEIGDREVCGKPVRKYWPIVFNRSTVVVTSLCDYHYRKVYKEYHGTEPKQDD